MDSVVSCTNYYGGIIGLVSLVIGVIGIALTIVLYHRTGKVENNIKKFLDEERYRKTKKAILENIDNIIPSMEDDDIYSGPIVGELEVNMTELSYYVDYMNTDMKSNFNNIISILGTIASRPIKDSEKQVLVSNLYKLKGHLKHKSPNIGM